MVALFVAACPWASTRLKARRDAGQPDRPDRHRGRRNYPRHQLVQAFSPRAETFDLSLRPSLPNREAPREATASLAWFGKAGTGFNGMYNREMQNAAPLGGEGYSIAPALDVVRDVPIQVWSCKISSTAGWAAADQGLDIDLQEENRQPTGTIANHLTHRGKSVTLTHAYLAYDGWAYALGTLEPGKTKDVDSSTRRVSLNTFMSSDSLEDAAGQGGQAEKTPYDAGSRDAAYVLRAMLFYDASGGRKRTGMSNDYQGHTDLSVFRTDRAVLVAMPPQDEAFRGAEILRDQKPLSGSLDRHTIIYRFIAPVGKGHEP